MKLTDPATTPTVPNVPLCESGLRGGMNAALTGEELQRACLTPGMVRVSVGLENIEDLIADFKQALTLYKQLLETGERSAELLYNAGLALPPPQSGNVPDADQKTVAGEAMWW